MNSNILKTIGLENLDPAIYIIALLVLVIAAIVYCVILTKKNNNLTEKYEAFISGKDGKSLEEEFVDRFEKIEKLIVEDREKSKAIMDIQNNLHITFEKVGIVKYDAFSEMGGKLSFALVLLNKDNTGFVINSMHSREGCYTYIKEIINGESYVALGDEEQIALNKALGKEEK